MFELNLLRSGRRHRVRWQDPHDLAIPLNFDGPQPSYLVEARAQRHPLIDGMFVGDFHRGGSCRVDVVEFIPHCHGTHTESVSHIADPLVPVRATCPSTLQLARLISVTLQPARLTGESYALAWQDGDHVVTRAELALQSNDLKEVTALIIRTLPNPPEKRHGKYRPSSPSGFLTHQAMQTIVEAGVEHLLVDLPSIDRLADGGLLSNHRLFWNVPPGETTWTDPVAARKTISEMLYIPSELSDGLYALSLSVPPWDTDAAPSRPLLYALETT